MTPEAWERLADKLATPTGLTRGASSFTRRDVIVALCERLPPGALVDRRTLESAANRLLASERVVALLPADGARADSFVRRDGQRIPLARDERRYSTPELLRRERRLVEFAVRGRGARAGVADPAAVARAFRTRPSLSTEQVVMVRELCAAGDSVAVVAGRAGTGKTFALAAAHDAWRATGVPVIGAAVARRAARELQDGAGIPSTSLAQLLGELDRGRDLPPRSVLVVDEAGMAGTRQLAALADAVERVGGKLVLVGDHRQLPALDAGGAFRSLVHRGLAVELTENRRQTEPWERAAVEHLRNGRSDEAIALYQQHGRIKLEPTDQHARDRLVRDYWNGGNNQGAIMIAQRRTDVADLNWRARGLMRAAGRLGDEELRIARGRIAAGDRVLIRANHPTSGLCNGDQAIVSDIDTRRRTATLAVGERLVVVGPDVLHGQTARGDPAVTLGYAMTGHAAQGVTVDRAHVLADSTITREWAYTAMTRGRLENHLYVAATEERARHEFAPVDREPASPLARLKARLAPERSERLALDLAPGLDSWDEAIRHHARIARVHSHDISPDRDIGLER